MECLPVKGTDTVYCNSGEDLANIRKGNFLLLEDEMLLFQIVEYQQLGLTFDASVKNHVVTVDQILDCLWRGDEIKLVFDVFEIDCCVVRSSGIGFTKKQKFSIAGFKNRTDEALDGVVEVTGTDSLGRITGVSVLDRGCFLSEKSTSLNLSNFKGGSADLDLVMRKAGLKAKQFTAENIYIHEGKSQILIRGHAEFPEVTGRICFDKHVIRINGLFPENISGVKRYSIINEFTPCLSLALLSQNCLHVEPVINRNFAILDAKIQELGLKIKELEAKLLARQ